MIWLILREALPSGLLYVSHSKRRECQESCWLTNSFSRPKRCFGSKWKLPGSKSLSQIRFQARTERPISTPSSGSWDMVLSDLGTGRYPPRSRPSPWLTQRLARLWQGASHPRDPILPSFRSALYSQVSAPSGPARRTLEWWESNMHLLFVTFSIKNRQILLFSVITAMYMLSLLMDMDRISRLDRPRKISATTLLMVRSIRYRYLPEWSPHTM